MKRHKTYFIGGLKDNKKKLGSGTHEVGTDALDRIRNTVNKSKVKTQQIGKE